VGVGKPGRHVEEAGHKQGGGSLPIGRRRPAGSSPRPAGTGDVRRVRTAGQIDGEGRG
jgi:hypothetical protein